MEQETLTGKQIKHLLLGNPIDSKEDPVFPPKPSTGKVIDKSKDDEISSDNKSDNKSDTNEDTSKKTKTAPRKKATKKKPESDN